MAGRVQIPFSFNYPASGNLAPAAGVSVTVTVRATSAPTTVFLAETGNSQYASLVTDAGGNVPGWVNEGSYRVTAAASGPFGGGSVAFEAVRGDGVSNVAPGVIDTAQLTSTLLGQLVPVGTVLDYAGANAPASYLVCNGAAVSRTTYAALFALLSTTFGAGDGSTTFNVPDLRGYVTVGAGTATWGTTRTLGVSGNPTNLNGHETITMTTNQMPSHTHVTSISTTGIYDSGHNHGVQWNDPWHSHAHGGGYVPEAPGAWGYLQVTLGTHDSIPYRVNADWANASQVQASPTGISISNLGAYAQIVDAGHGHTLSAVGSGASINNMPPFVVINKIIKY